MIHHFRRWMRKTELSDAALCKAVAEMDQGLIDADLGGGVMKKRVPLPGRGKSGGARTLVATNKGDRWFFLYGFAKNQRDSRRVGGIAEACRGSAQAFAGGSGGATRGWRTAGDMR